MNAIDLVHWTEERKEDKDFDAGFQVRKKCWQFRVSENMPAILVRIIRLATLV